MKKEKEKEKERIKIKKNIKTEKKGISNPILLSRTTYHRGIKKKDRERYIERVQQQKNQD